MLLGRARERVWLEDLLGSARAGCSAVLGLVGEPGIGKTTLLAEGASAAGSSGFRVLRVRGLESEAHIPFASLLELARPVLGSMPSLPEPQALALEGALALRPARPAERFAVGAATLSLLAACSEDRPILVVVDDAHWLDLSSSEALRFAFRRLVADPIAVLIAAREGERSLLDGSGLPVEHLSGLDATDAAALLARSPLGAQLGPDLTARAVEATGGNPLALIELARGVDLVGLAAGSTAVVPLPTALSQAFLRRARALPPATLRLLVLAAAHDDGDAATLEKAAGRLGLDFAAIAEAESAEVLTVSAGRVEFRHPLARSAVYSAAPPDARREAHRVLAAVLSDRDVDRRAWHLASAAVGTDAAASAALRQAGGRARDRSAYAVAAAAFERSARLSPDDDLREALFWEAAQAAWLAGSGDRSRELLATARAIAPGRPASAEMAHLEGQIAVHRGPVMEGHAVLLAGAVEAEPDQAVEMLADAAIACFYAGRPGEMLATAARAGRRLVPSSSGRARYLHAMVRGMSLILGGDAEVGADTIREAGRFLDPAADPGDPGWTTWLVMGPMWLREGVAARNVVEEALEAARSRSAVGALPFLLNHLARDQAGGDAWMEAGACYEEAIELSRETGQRTELGMALAGRAWLEARQGREEPCREHAAEAATLCRDLGIGLFEVWALAALGDLELGMGRPSGAAGHYRRQAALLDRLGITDPDLSPLPDLVDACVRLGRGDEAKALAGRFEAAAEGKGQAWSRARAARANGLVADERSLDSWFRSALELQAETPDRFEQARTQLAYGARLRRARRRADARVPLRQAFETFDRLGARPWAEAARVELDATGETIHSRAEGALHLLTAQEMRIALLLADGMTTREAAAALFVSPKTVEYHLRHVYQKLGVRTRDALRPALDTGP